MKSFAHLRRLSGCNASRAALRHYAYYRACRLAGSIDIQSLKDFHVYETTGALPNCSLHEFRSVNGYASGKWAAKVTQTQILEDIASGNSVKAEFMNTSHEQKLWGPQMPLPIRGFKYARGNWFIHKYLEKALAGDCFGYEDREYWLNSIRVTDGEVAA